MTEEAQKKLVVVLGMHRGGTSALTRGLVALGIELGDHLMSALPENPKGYWEDLDIQGLNVDLLSCLGHDWYTLDLISAADLASERAIAVRSRAIELLRQKTADTNIYGIKDPRIARLLPFWQSVFDHLRLEVGYVIAVRNPLSVAHSMKARMKWLEPEKSYYLWLEHMV
ncbi:MAG: glycosyl transferase, partial [Anaerolineae bacterium]|nr:glycosyl transferase [Anaerolineae bacterium]